MTLVEIMVALAALTMILCGVLASMDSETRRFSQMVDITARERAGREMIGKVESLLEYSIGATPQAFLLVNLAAGDVGGTAELDLALGFPPTGTILIEPGTAWEERLGYTSIDPVANQILGLAPGAQCTVATGHLAGQRVYWAGMATAIADQVAPPASEWDGRAASDSPVFFRGDGTGFSFRMPTDPDGGDDFVDADGAIKWGATVSSTPTLEGWAALTFAPRAVLREDADNVDLNGDGDFVDVFDLGRIEMVTWNAIVGGMEPTVVGLCPPIVLQEQCNWGGDLDGDGFDDPIFLWIPDEGRLELRLFLAVGDISTIEIVRPMSSTIHLRNGSL